jgi:hypothetical protein
MALVKEWLLVCEKNGVEDQKLQNITADRRSGKRLGLARFVRAEGLTPYSLRLTKQVIGRWDDLAHTCQHQPILYFHQDRISTHTRRRENISASPPTSTQILPQNESSTSKYPSLDRKKATPNIDTPRATTTSPEDSSL